MLEIVIMIERTLLIEKRRMNELESRWSTGWVGLQQGLDNMVER